MKSDRALNLVIAAGGLALVASATGVAKAAPPPPVAQTVRPAASAPPRPGYAVVQGEHPENEDLFQSLTVVCPDRMKAFGAGFSAVIRNAAAKAGALSTYHEEGLDRVRSVPDSAGNGWQVEGIASGAATVKQPWKLVVRVVCVRVVG